MALTIYIPYTRVDANGTMTALTAPTVDTLPTAPDANGVNQILTVTTGVYTPGAYQWVSGISRWRLVIDYVTICQQLFGLSQGFTCLPNAGDNLLPIGPSGTAVVVVYRNGAKITNYTVISTGISLQTPAIANDVFCVVWWSPISASNTPAGGGGSGGGIPDAPNDGTPYVRKSLAWEGIQNELTEGLYTGH